MFHDRVQNRDREALIPAAGGSDVEHLVTLNNPLAFSTYTYVLEILAQSDHVLCGIDLDLVHAEAPGLSQERDLGAAYGAGWSTGQQREPAPHRLEPFGLVYGRDPGGGTFA
jgi:hypothetical protein